MWMNRGTRSIQIAFMTLIGLGTLLLVGGATAAINSYNAYLPLIIKEATATPSPMMVCSNPSNPIPIP
jgi:purine-cytosine permease-like protein